ncbi:hypothetical protein Rcae01_04549 [Novipirellula caenicola]|uniref:Uncharacterized protein n=1 Tax=Novipirellula caenicola TaxID=1536901 RepID=A0ABP9VWX3_9BACT
MLALHHKHDIGSNYGATNAPIFGIHYCKSFKTLFRNDIEFTVAGHGLDKCRTKSESVRFYLANRLTIALPIASPTFI